MKIANFGKAGSLFAMNPNRFIRRLLPGRPAAVRPLLLMASVTAAALLGLPGHLPPGASACLTANLDKRAVQWSPVIVQAKLISLGEKADLPSTSDSATTRPSGRPVAKAYRVVTFEVTQAVDGNLRAGAAVKVVTLVGGRPGDGACPALLPESVGKQFVLLLRPFEETGVDVADGTYIAPGRGAMVIVTQLGEADMNSETLNDLKTFVSKTRDAAANTKADQINAQADALAAAHDQTEADQAEKALDEIGPEALPALEARLKTANAAGRTRLRRVIDDLSPPALSAEPE